jgi:hypothetical protein
VIGLQAARINMGPIGKGIISHAWRQHIDVIYGPHLRCHNHQGLEVSPPAGYFIPASRIRICCATPVRNAVSPVIGLSSLAMEKAPLRSGIASFSRRSKSYSEGHYIFILECHGRD